MNEKEIYLIDLVDLIKKVFKHLFLIIILTILFGLGSFAYSNFVVTPSYNANATMIISSSSKNEDQQDLADIDFYQIQANKALISTYSEIVKSKGIADQVIKNLSLNMGYEEFSKKVSIEPVKDTQIISVNVVDSVPTRAMDIANETANIFKSSIGDIMKVDNVQILDGATIPVEPVSPNVSKNTVVGAIIGLVLGIIISMFKELYDISIKSAEEVEEYLNLPVIGVLPDVKKGN
ncbi:YveK family protein [Anaerococcus prevotii]|uniref:Putative capsular polysaccharide type 8 biosynthesis protein cap8A n=1 Tax=Anaerococcus prevotii ACS-065-V-Col13 TaxID=879305 RepID=F0GT82_9FIRM|nr:Wzz/FepE/Etk N-terminal domain-containing protein [Anaerococcus prevotii]EGC82957.1 putative capsular polysaccharide type 8 biosynthesis protein cap8A [Anaerococcus prevotii ACS-065-V-Col13]